KIVKKNGRNSHKLSFCPGANAMEPLNLHHYFNRRNGDGGGNMALTTSNDTSCFSDFRVDITNCPETAGYLHTLLLANIICCSIVLISLFCLLVYRARNYI